MRKLSDYSDTHFMVSPHGRISTYVTTTVVSNVCGGKRSYSVRKRIENVLNDLRHFVGC